MYENSIHGSVQYGVKRSVWFSSVRDETIFIYYGISLPTLNNEMVCGVDVYNIEA